MSDCFEGRLAEATRIVVLGVGTEFRSDDIAGILVARQVEKAFAARSDLLVIQGCSAPENFTGPIIGFYPSHLVVIDCAELEAPSGTVKLFPIENIAGVSSNTHSLPLNVVFDYILKNCPCEILVVGIQPRSLEFDGSPSKEVVDAARLIARTLIGVVRSMGKR